MSSQEAGKDAMGEDSGVGGGGSGSSCGSDLAGSTAAAAAAEKRKEKDRVSRTSLILWHTHQNDVLAVKKLLEEDHSLVAARDYDSRTPLHVAALHGWIEVAKCLLDCGADVNAQDRWKNTVNILRAFSPSIPGKFIMFIVFLCFVLRVDQVAH